MEESTGEWTEVDDTVFCKIDPFSMRALVMKVERKGIPKQYLLRKRQDKILTSLTKRYAEFDTDYFDPENEVQEEKDSADTDGNEEVASRLALGLLRIRCSRRVKSFRSASKPGEPTEPTGQKAIIAEMSRNRWQVAVGMVMGMAKMASHSIQDDHEPFCVGDLSFDVNFFKANRNEIVLTADSKFVLNQLPEKRTKEQIDDVIKNLDAMGVKSFNDYPKAVQQKLLKVARYEVITPQRVIVRQGCSAENLYFLISGNVLVMKKIQNPRKNKDSEKMLTLQKGATFGELEMVNRFQRTATAISSTNVELLSIGSYELHNVFTDRQSKTDLPDHVKFLKKCEFLSFWPIERLSHDNDYCAPYFFKRNTLMVEDIEKTDWIFIIRSGLCRVIRKLWMPHWKAKKRCELTEQTAASKRVETQEDVFKKRFSIYYPLDSRISRIFGGKANSRKIFLNSMQTASRKKGLAKVPRKKYQPIDRLASLGNNRPTFEKQLTSEYIKIANRETKLPALNEKETEAHEKDQFRLEQLFVTIGLQDEEKEGDKLDDLGSGEGDEPVYIQIDTLRPYDVFGLDTLVFDSFYDRPCHPGLSLASSSDERGVDVVLVSKSYFVEHASEQVAWRVRKMAKSYPEADVLERNLDRCRLWKIYKRDVVSEVLVNKLKYPKNVPWK